MSWRLGSLLALGLATVCVAVDDDLLRPSEMHLTGVPQFLLQPHSRYYTHVRRPATFECMAEPVNHMTVVCSERVYPVRPNSPVQVTKEGLRWHLRLNITSGMVMETLNPFTCYCEAWNNIDRLNKPKKVHSNPSTIEEAYMEKLFQMEPVSSTLNVGSQLTLQCKAPDSVPSAELSWLKDGVPVTRQSAPHIHINAYSSLEIPEVAVADSGQYTCVARLFDLENRTSVASVQIIDPKRVQQPPVLPPHGPRLSSPEPERRRPSEFHRKPDQTETGVPLSRRDFFIYLCLCLSIAAILIFGVIALVLGLKRGGSRTRDRFGGHRHSTLDKDPIKHATDYHQLRASMNPVSADHSESGHLLTHQNGPWASPNLATQQEQPAKAPTVPDHVVWHGGYAAANPAVTGYNPCQANTNWPNMTPKPSQITSPRMNTSVECNANTALPSSKNNATHQTMPNEAMEPFMTLGTATNSSFSSNSQTHSFCGSPGSSGFINDVAVCSVPNPPLIEQQERRKMRRDSQQPDSGVYDSVIDSYEAHPPQTHLNMAPQCMQYFNSYVGPVKQHSR